MSRLPQMNGRDIIAAFRRAGWSVDRQRGSHVLMTKPGSVMSLSIPLHNPVGRGLLHDLISKSDLSIEEFLDLL
jgi:predicted RNA binding protein YcfA (HicA-like mRNA interferase family)